jgi:hypothetical protein
MALAGEVIASHYAEPLPRKLAAASPLRSSPGDEAEMIGDLQAGDPFELLDDSLGWAWGYGGPDRLVGYVRSECLA